MKNILVPTDFSPDAENALLYAVQLTRQWQGRIIIFHNAELPINYAGTNIYASAAGDVGLGASPLYHGVVYPDPELEKAQKEKLDQLAHLVGQSSQGTVPVTTLFKYGSLTSNLQEIIAQEQADLIVMGTKGASSFIDRFIGTNTASVIKETHGIPVLAIPGNSRYATPRRLIFAADLEDETEIFLDQLLPLAEPFGAQVTLVHIHSQNQPEIIDEAAIMADLQRRFPGHRLQLIERSGKTVAKGLEDYIHENPADWLAVGVREHGFWYSLFHSSVTEELVFQAHLPLLVLPEKPLLRA